MVVMILCSLWLCPSLILDVFPWLFPMNVNLVLGMLGCWLLIVFLGFLPLGLFVCVMDELRDCLSKCWMDGCGSISGGGGYKVGRILLVATGGWFAGLRDAVIGVMLGCWRMDGWRVRTKSGLIAFQSSKIVSLECQRNRNCCREES